MAAESDWKKRNITQKKPPNTYVVGPATFGPILTAYPTPLVVALWVAARHVVATVGFQNGQIASGALPRVLLHPFFTQPLQCLLV